MRVIGGKYEVVRQLGEGGMGAVYEAKHTGTGRRVAVKEIIGESLRSNPSVVERFQREARATGAIETQHIAVVLDTGTDEETKHPYLVMEFLKGEDLQQLIGRLGPLPESLALRIVAQACVGLSRAHEAGVIHRDIKPANLFLARRDADEIVVKLLDFGIARVREGLGGAEKRALTTTGAMLGSPLYMSPEQAQDAKNLDHRTDLWSLGVVLHEALVGKTPHGDIDTVGALIVAICSKPARPLQEFAPHVSPGTCAIVKKALELDPAARYQTADEFLAALKKQIGGALALDESMLVALPSKQAMELAATTPAPVQGSTTAGVASQQPVSTAQPKLGSSPISLAAIAVGVLGTLGVAAYKVIDVKTPAISPIPTATAVTSAPVAPSTTIVAPVESAVADSAATPVVASASASASASSSATATATVKPAVRPKPTTTTPAIVTATNEFTAPAPSK